MREWLESVGLGQYAELFAQHDIDAQIFADLTEDDLEKLGISIGHRKRLLKARAEGHAAAPPPTPRPRDATLPVEVSVKPQRRQLTVLTCDLVGSAALSAQLDPEDLRELLHEVQHRCDEAIRRYDGHIARVTGDGMLAYFGFPVAQEDAAERAANAALELVAAVSAIAASAEQRIAARVGIATGLVVVGDRLREGAASELELIGEAPNLAAGLQQLAQPNQILVSAQTRTLLGDLFELEDLGERSLKGLERSGQIWRVLQPATIGSRFEARRTAHLTPLVGREAELGLLLDRFQRIDRDGGQMVLIAGEPGIGKSRLVAALRERVAAHDCSFVSLQCSSYHSSSAWYPLIRHLEEAAGIARDTPPAARLERLEGLVDRCLGEQGRSVVPLLAALLSLPLADTYPAPTLSPQQQKARTLSALLGLFDRRAPDPPMLLVCDDVHWLDPTSMELLEKLREQIRCRRMLAVLLFRPEFDLPWGEHPNVTPLALNRLDREQMAAMIQAVAGAEALAPTTVDQIAARTDGVPLFIEEMTKAVVEDGGAGRDELAAATLDVPATLHDSLMARLDRVAPMKTVAQAAAAIGREFSLDILETIAPLPPADLRAAVDRLLAAGLVHPVGPATNRAYAFKHALVRDEAYASLLRDERRALHVAVAEALAGKFAAMAETSPEITAHHFALAGRTQQAIDYWLKAAQRASDRSAFIEASAHVGHALELLRSLPPSADRDRSELKLQQSLGNALAAGKGFGAAETIEAFRRALELCGTVGDTAQTFVALNGMISIHLVRGEYEQSRDLAEDLLTRAAKVQDSTPRLMGHRALGMSLFLIGELPAARDQLHRCLDLYDARQHGPTVFPQDSKATAEAYLALTLVVLGDVERGLAHGRAGLAHAEALQHPHSVCYTLAFLAGALVLCRDVPAAFAVAERAMALAREHEFPLWLAGGQMMRGSLRVERGEIEAGLAELQSSVDALTAAGALIWVRFARYLRAQALAKAGKAKHAFDTIDASLNEIRGTRGRWYEADLHRLRGDLLTATGADFAASEAAYKTAMAIAARQGARLWQLRAATRLCELYRRNGRGADVDAILAPLCAGFGAESTSVDLEEARAVLRLSG